MTNTVPVAFARHDWDAYAVCYDTLLKLTPYQHLLNDVATHLAPRQGDTVLDAGCGTGNLLTHLALNYAGASFVGADRSASMLARAALKCRHASTVRITYADLGAALPFGDAAFSKAASVNVLYTVENPLHVLRELWRILAPKGTLVLVTPKHGYDNGLILRAHAGSNTPEAYWRDAHASEEREEFLLREAVQDEALVRDLLLVARYNRAIATTAQFHFFTKDELVSLLVAAGFIPHTVTMTYAGQAHLIAATKGDLS